MEKAEDGAAATAGVAAEKEEKEEERICRICLDGEAADAAENPLIAPCRCAGSMRYVHRGCLDEWRVSCFNPKALAGCTTCHTTFRVCYQGRDASALGRGEDGAPLGRRWWVRFGCDVAWFVALRLAGFLATVVATGFLPWLPWVAGAALHPNPVLSHLLYGTGTTLALLGCFVTLQLPGIRAVHESFRILEALCPRRGGGGGGGGGGNAGNVLLLILILLGLACCLFFLIRGIVRLFNEGRHEVVRAVCGANKQVRRQVVKDYVVLDLLGGSCEKGAASGAAHKRRQLCHKTRECSSDPSF